MPIDANIFAQYAQLNSRDNENLVNQIGNAAQNYTKGKQFDKQYQLAEKEAAAKGFDFEKIAMTADMKMAMGETPTPQEMAIRDTYQKYEAAKQSVDPYTGQAYPKFRPFGINPRAGDISEFPMEGGGIPQGFDLSNLPSESYVGGTATIPPVVTDDNLPSVPKLDISMLEPAGDPSFDVRRAEQALKNESLQNNGVVSDAQFEADTPKGFNMGLVEPLPSEGLRLTPEQRAMSPRKANEAAIDLQKDAQAKMIDAEIDLNKEKAKNAQSKSAKISSLSSAIQSIDAIAMAAPNAPSGRLEGFAASLANQAGYPTEKSLGAADIEPKIELLTTALKDYIRSPGEGNWTDADQKKLDKLAPKETDSTAVKLQKLKSLKSEFERLQGGKANDFSGFKYLGVE